MNREEALKVIKENRIYYRDWKQEEFDKAIEKLNEPLTLGDFLGWEEGVNDEMDDSVREYFEFLFDKLNELVIEDISYSDYDQMTDWLGEIRRQVKRLEKKQEPMKPIYDHRYSEMCCSVCGSMIGGWEERPSYCPQCGQAIDWSEE